MLRILFTLIATATMSACGSPKPAFDREQYKELVGKLKVDTVWTYTEPRVGMVAWNEIQEVGDCQFAVRSGGATRSSFVDNSFDIRSIHANSDGVDQDDISGYVNLSCNDNKACTTERGSSRPDNERHGYQIGPRVPKGRQVEVFKTIEDLRTLCLSLEVATPKKT